MDGKLGRKRRLSLFAVTGNGNGLAGFALTKASTAHDAMRSVKRKATQNLMYIDRCEGHTGKPLIVLFYTESIYTFPFQFIIIFTQNIYTLKFT